MRDLRVALGALLWAVSAPALALPWDTDLMDSDAVKAYEQAMRPLPEGIASQPHALTPMPFRANFAWTSDARMSMVNPADASDAAVLAKGERMYGIYCETCHGVNAKLGPVWEKGMVVIPALGGPDGRLANLPDGHVYLTVRNGSLSKLMGPYGYAMTEEEIWATIAWMRTNLDNAVYTPPTPPAAEAP